MILRVQFIMPIALILTACSTAAPNPASVYTRVTEATLQAGDPIPAPEERIILTVTGKIGAANEDEHIVMDLATLEMVGLVEYTVIDPFKEEEISYRGPLMSDLLDVWQVSEDATVLDILALNDYRVEVPISDLRQYPVIFALQADGEYMAVEERGPAMLVYPYNDYEFERPLYDAYWIWQIETIDVK